MPKFNFKLQRVLEIKEHKEEVLKNELAEIKRMYNYEESVLWNLEERGKECIAELHKKQVSTILIEEILWYYAYLIKLEGEIKLQREKLAELLKKIEELTQRLIKASQEKRVLERLKERRFEEFKLELEREEQKFIDEVALTGYIRGVNQLSYRRELE